jgi:hypothetical protein
MIGMYTATKFWYYKYYVYYIALLLPIDDVSSAVYQGPPALLMPLCWSSTRCPKPRGIIYEVW